MALNLKLPRASESHQTIMADGEPEVVLSRTVDYMKRNFKDCPHISRVLVALVS